MRSFIAEKCRDSRTQIDGYLTRKNIASMLRPLVWTLLVENNNNNNNNNNNGFITAFPQRGSTSAKVYIKIYYTINRKSLRKFKTKD
jgi:hypothetical protein